ncbi:DUF222 domain-containing protein [Tessaracoccus sp. HDW20]|nr:DUF222 domain-containing protein [Tessaracoccus coleopterorum]
MFARLNTAADKLATRLTITAADLDHRHIAETATGLNLSTWLMSKRHATRAQASKVMRTGHALAAHPQVQEAAISGAVSKDQANAITTLLDNLPTRLRDEQKARAAAFLVEKAKSNNTNQLRGLTTEALDAADPAISEADAAEREQAHLQAQRERAIRNRAFRHRYEDGSLHFSGQVPTSEGAELVRLLEAQVAADRRDERDHPQAGALHPHPSSATPMPSSQSSAAATAQRRSPATPPASS